MTAPTIKTDPKSSNSIQQKINQKADPINRNLEKRYKSLVEEAQLKDKINMFEAQKLIQQFDEKGIMDLNLIRSQKASESSLALIDTNKNDFSKTLNPYLPTISLVIVLIFLGWLKSINAYQKIYEFFLGENGLSQSLLEAMGKAKPKVSESQRFLHNKAFNEIRVLARAAIAIDNERFGQQEFLLFAKLRFCMNNNIKEYQSSSEYLSQFQAILQAQKSCILLNQIEMSCQGRKQQEFYHFVNQELLHLEDLEVIKTEINNRYLEVLPQIQTEEGRLKLESYIQDLYTLISYPQAIAFFRRFKTSDLASLQSIHKIANIIAGLKEQDVTDLRSLTFLTMNHYDDFEILGDMIAMTDADRSPDTYARLVQYIGLSYRYQESFVTFQLLIQKIREWYKPYQAIVQIRQAHPEGEYRQPQEFNREIPGLSLYLTYKNSLTDQKTGYSYIDFGEVTEQASMITLVSEATVPQKDSLLL